MTEVLITAAVFVKLMYKNEDIADNANSTPESSNAIVEP
jgi:hypothetical protein